MVPTGPTKFKTYDTGIVQPVVPLYLESHIVPAQSTNSISWPTYEGQNRNTLADHNPPNVATQQVTCTALADDL
jgi:hypothetical protein